MGESLYVDTSAVLRATLETGTTPEIENRLRDAERIVASRLAMVESARALLRVSALGSVSEARLADLRRELTAFWAGCGVWDLTIDVCEEACRVSPTRPLRALDALHLATCSIARRKIPGLRLLTADERMEEAAVVLV